MRPESLLRKVKGNLKCSPAKIEHKKRLNEKSFPGEKNIMPLDPIPPEHAQLLARKNSSAFKQNRFSYRVD